MKIAYSPGYALPRGGGGGGRRGGGAAAAPAVNDTNLIAAAVEAAKSADVVIFVGGLSHSQYDQEGSDRRDMKLPGGQDELLNQTREGESQDRGGIQRRRRGGNGCRGSPRCPPCFTPGMAAWKAATPWRASCSAT